jgi:hypothetical protein
VDPRIDGRQPPLGGSHALGSVHPSSPEHQDIAARLSVLGRDTGFARRRLGEPGERTSARAGERWTYAHLLEDGTRLEREIVVREGRVVRETFRYRGPRLSAGGVAAWVEQTGTDPARVSVVGFAGEQATRSLGEPARREATEGGEKWIYHFSLEGAGVQRVLRMREGVVAGDTLRLAGCDGSSCIDVGSPAGPRRGGDCIDVAQGAGAGRGHCLTPD